MPHNYVFHLNIDLIITHKKRIPEVFTFIKLQVTTLTLVNDLLNDEHIVATSDYLILCPKCSTRYLKMNWRKAQCQHQLLFYFKFSPESSNGTQSLFGFRINNLNWRSVFGCFLSFTNGRHIRTQLTQWSRTRELRETIKVENVNWNPFKRYHFMVLARLSKSKSILRPSRQFYEKM